jgi:hypothetical protein
VGKRTLISLLQGLKAKRPQARKDTVPSICKCSTLRPYTVEPSVSVDAPAAGAKWAASAPPFVSWLLLAIQTPVVSDIWKAGSNSDDEEALMIVQVLSSTGGSTMPLFDKCEAGSRRSLIFPRLVLLS